MSQRGVRIRPRVWCFTPHPVLETKFETPAGRIVSSAGGKAHNVARQLHRWSVPAISVVGYDGGEGKAWWDLAQREGLKVWRIPVRAGERQGWAVLKKGVGRIDFFTQDLRIEPRDWKKVRDFWIRNLKQGDWWVVAGSSATGWPRGWWRRLIGDVQKKGVSVLVDSRGAILREAVAAGADWIKCNLSEAEQTTGRKGVGGCIPKLAGSETTGVVITLGQKGLVAVVNGVRLSIPAPTVKVVDATGSGDVVTAALIYGEINGWSTVRTLRKAAWLGSIHAACRDGKICGGPP